MRSALSAMKEYFVVDVLKKLAIRLIQEHQVTNVKNARLSGINWVISLYS